MKKIVLDKDSVVYVLSPCYFKTGGTELLHQYVSTARKAGINCKIVYPSATQTKNINPAFRCYVDDYLTLEELDDSQNNVIIVPEIYTGYLRLFKNLRVVVWWESVDNYLKTQSLTYHLKHFADNPKQSLGYLFRIVLGKQKSLPFRLLKKNVDFHFVQSEYARLFLEQKGIIDNVFYVSDYINDMYLSGLSDPNNKKNIVCYNPAKGRRFTEKIIERAKGVSFVPLVNMTNEQVFNTLLQAKVYIDFGDHPGKDRFPREAAMMGCCVITGKNGSARNDEDIYIDKAFKFDQRSNEVKRIIEMIQKCLCNYDEMTHCFDRYRQRIAEEKNCFEENLIDCFEVRQNAL